MDKMTNPRLNRLDPINAPRAAMDPVNVVMIPTHAISVMVLMRSWKFISSEKGVSQERETFFFLSQNSRPEDGLKIVFLRWKFGADQSGIFHQISKYFFLLHVIYK